jgi:hypothetical protein
MRGNMLVTLLLLSVTSVLCADDPVKWGLQVNSKELGPLVADGLSKGTLTVKGKQQTFDYGFGAMVRV